MMDPIRVLYSFPHRIGAARICTTAWHQVSGLAKAGAEVIAMPGSVVKPLPATVRVDSTLLLGGVRIPYRLIGDRRAFWLHDAIVARRLVRLAGSIDVVHAWPLGALKTLKVAAALGIPTVLERPNAHTRFAYEVVSKECERIGVPLPSGHEHAFNEQVLRREEEEYALATTLMCPSDFVARSFADRGFARSSISRHQYGYDADRYRPAADAPGRSGGLEVIFVGGCAPRKGLHHALEAWLRSPASRTGRFRIVGAFIPGYAEYLSSMLSHPSIEVLGHRNDVPELMRQSDILVLPSIEEGSALVTSEARGSGCVLLVSDAAGAVCNHMHDGLIHQAGDVDTLRVHMNLLEADRGLLQRLRQQSLAGRDDITWDAAGRRLLQIYREVVSRSASTRRPVRLESWPLLQKRA